MNDTWIVGDPAAGPADAAVIRQHRFTERRRVETEHEVMAAARAGGVPVPEILGTSDGEPILSYAGRWWTAYSFVRGVQVARSDLTVAHAEAMGRALGHINHTLAMVGLPPEQVRDRRPATAEQVLAEIHALRVLIAERPERGIEEDWADRELAERAEWIARHGLPEPEAVPPEQTQLTHGDYQHANLFFEDGPPPEVSGVIDWDKCDRDDPAAEVVRCLNLSLSFSEPHSRAFLAGYRSVTTLEPEVLARAVHNLHARTVRDLWVPQMVYRHGDDRVRQFLSRTGFTPVVDLWPSGLQ